MAFAGGFEFPGNGTEALGRGAAFTAKADSPLALDYNVGGLAKQRGTRLLFDSNLVIQDFEFSARRQLPDRERRRAACALRTAGSRSRR